MGKAFLQRHLYPVQATPYASSVQLILRRVKNPFVATQVLGIPHGELFPRPQFEQQLASMLSRGVYAACYGPGESGKSAAILYHKSIDDCCGVLRFSLRGVGNDIASNFAADLGLPGGLLCGLCMCVTHGL